MALSTMTIFGPRQANLLLIAYASSEGSGEPAHPRSLARTFAARSYKQWVKRNLQTESQIPGPSEWLGMRSWNLSWPNARRHKFAWRGPFTASLGSSLIVCWSTKCLILHIGLMMQSFLSLEILFLTLIIPSWLCITFGFNFMDINNVSLRLGHNF